MILPLSLALLAFTGVGIAAAVSPAKEGATSATCGSLTTVFCEDFEHLTTGPAGSANWGIDTRHATMTVERQATPGGKKSNKVLHLHTVDNGRAFLRVDDFAAPANSFYGRMRLRVGAFPTAPDWAHFTLVEATGSGSTEVVRPLGGQYAPTAKGSFWGLGADGGPTGDWTNWRESAPTTANTWQCVEWKLDSANNQVALWFDGVANPELTASGTDHGGNAVPFVLPKVDTVKIGWQLYQGGTTPGAFDLWIDDVALSSERIGC